MIDLEISQFDIVCDLLKKHVSGHEVRAFGSRAHGTSKPYSDLDLAISGPLDFETTRLLREALEVSNLTIRVEFVDWSRVADSFKKAIGDWDSLPLIQHA